jgi:hypothetical protein
MTRRQQIIQERVRNLVDSVAIPQDEAFERLVLSLVTGQSVHSVDPEDWVDGSQDKQIDLISIEEEDSEAEICIISAKYTGGFSSNAIILMRNGLDWIFNRPRSELAGISNESFRDRIHEIRSTVSGFGPSNVTVRCYFATNGLTSELSDEFGQEARGIISQYDNQTFASFSFEALGADNLVDLINKSERKNRSLDADVPIRYDFNTPSLIRYDSQGLKGVICTVNAKDIANLVNTDTNGAIFDSNIRRFLGKRRSVNSDILRTATDPQSSYFFWFLNNGITVVCERCDIISDPDNPMIKITNIQIVNGCQTATALAHASRDGTLRSDTRVLLKVFETPDDTLASRIVLTTNNQNRISSRDLKANDQVQQDMQRGFDRYQLLYEHKVNQYATTPPPPGYRIVSNEEVGQSYLAIALKKPGDARRRKYKVWTLNYQEIFSGERVEPHVVCVLLSQAIAAWAKETRGNTGITELRRKLLSAGHLHIARIAAFLWRGFDHFNQDRPELESQISTLRNNAPSLTGHFEDATIRLEAIIDANPGLRNDVDAALKSTILETEITRSLQQSGQSEPAAS